VRAVLCFCLPCLIRILARFQDPMRGKGATPSAINKLPTMKYRQVGQVLMLLL
jgi:E3 ubiquitin-protein ligase RNF38/44